MKRENWSPFLTFMWFCLGISVGVAAEPLADWTWRNPLPQGNALNAVAFGNDTFVAVGGYGTVMISSNGMDWEAISVSGADTNFGKDIVFGNGVFVTTGSGKVYLSTDGRSWRREDFEIYVSPRTLGFGNGIFVALDYGERILYSTDGCNWQPALSDVATLYQVQLNGVTYGNGLFVAVGKDWETSGDVVMSSPDGIHWTTQNLNNNGKLNAVVFGQAMFLAVGDRGIYTSENGRTWSYYAVAAGSDWSDLKDVIFNGSIFLGVGDKGIVTSSDGKRWDTRFNNEVGPEILGITNDGGHYVAVGSQGRILSAENINSWIESAGTSQNLGSISGITYGTAGYLAVGYRYLYYSGDGANWTISEMESFPWFVGFSDLTYWNNLYIASAGGWCIGCGSRTDYGYILSSADGKNWEIRSDTEEAPYDMTAGNGLIVAVGRMAGSNPYGASWTSRDGTTWTRHKLAADLLFNALSYSGTTFVAVGNNGTIAQSTDGITWNRVASGTQEHLHQIACGNETCVVPAGKDRILVSRNHGAWVSHDLDGENRQFGFVAFADGRFVAIDTWRNLFTSPDGVVWTNTARLPSDQGISAMFLGPNGYFLAGGGGSILQSEPLTGTQSCHATLGDDLVLRIPLLPLAGKYYSLSLQYVMDGENPFLFQLTEFQETVTSGCSNPAEFDAVNMKLFLPLILVNGHSMWADFSLEPNSGSGIRFRLTGAGYK